MNTRTTPVTVIIPNYNSEKYLEDCIKSINTGQLPAEILIIDDCSTDGSIDIAISLEARHENIRVLRCKKNGGAAEARKLGISEASQDWVALVDADDSLEIDAIKSAYIKAQEERSDICIWDMWRFDSEKSWPNILLNANDFPKSGKQAVIDTLNGWKIHPLGVAKKEIYLNAYSGFSETCLNADELITRLLFASTSKVSFSEKRYFYRVNINSSTQKISKKRLSVLESYIWLLKFAKTYPEVKPEIIGTSAISQAWHFFKNRKLYGKKATAEAISKFIPEFSKHGDLKKWLWRRPKYLIAFFVILLACRV